jgi:hypothetical protein
MASGPRKASVLQQDLPPVIQFDESSCGYLVRYRIVSEDKNRFSSWSPVEKVVAFDGLNLPGTVSGNINVQGTSINIVWGDAINRPKYDIFISFDEGEFAYHGTSSTHNYSIINTTSALQVSAIIQVESINKQVNPILTICQLSATIEP